MSDEIVHVQICEKYVWLINMPGFFLSCHIDGVSVSIPVFFLHRYAADTDKV